MPKQINDEFLKAIVEYQDCPEGYKRQLERSKELYQRKKREDPNFMQRRREQWRKWKKTNREKANKIKRKSFKKNYWLVKEKITKLLGGKCVKCGYTGLALQIDHVNGGGVKHLHSCTSPIKYYHQILEAIMSESKDYQLLCANCNWEKRIENDEH